VTLFPRHVFTGRVAVLWLASCAAILVVMLSQPAMQGEERSALKVLLPLYFLSFPLGHLGLMACTEIRMALYSSGETVPAILLEGLFLWTSMAVLGYAQWFLLVPLLSRKCRQVSDFLLARRRG